MTQNHKHLWEKCRDFFRDNLSSPEQFAAWFEPLEPLEFVDGALTIYAPSQYFVEQLEERYLQLINVGIRKFFGPETRLFYEFTVAGDDEAGRVTLAPSNKSTAVSANEQTLSNPFCTKPAVRIDSNLNPRNTFANYCSSKSNQLARSIAEAIATQPNLRTFNPLFIFGSTGVGKTHLIQAIGLRMLEDNPDLRVLYVTARLFESQYTTAVTSHNVNDFINFYQSIDVLIVDDIQDFVGKKPATQNAFFHIFNHLHQNQKHLILSSDCPPAQMEGLEQRLLQRFKWGMTAELERPDYELRREVLQQKALQDGLQIPQDVIEFIASNVTESIRELEGIVVSLLAHSMLMNCELSIELARKVISNAVRNIRHQINFEMIVRHVCDYYGIDSDALFTKTRKREVSDARQMVMFMAKKHAKMSLASIGARFSRTHATVIHACRNIEERLPLEKKLREDVEKIEQLLQQQS
ncbi:MAG: chromosomal replication initiator protein DnaA [Muribaculaceae bacterium]|nr:chromosomal replication initiator protein DnaA [Muribaculaceae bacterium]